MMRIIVKILVIALVILAITFYEFIPGISVANFVTAVIVAVVLGLLNAFIKPVVMFLTLPINLLSLGLFTLIINAVLFWSISLFVEGFDVAGFMAAFLGALMISFAQFILSIVID